LSLIAQLEAALRAHDVVIDRSIKRLERGRQPPDNASSLKRATMETKRSLVTVNARPEPLTIDLTKTAVLVIDMQNDFCAPGGGFDRAGVDIRMVRNIIPFISEALAAARSSGVQVVYAKMEHRPDLSDLGGPDDPHRIKHGFISVGQRVAGPNGQEGRILVKGTWNTEIIPELAPAPGDLIISKNRYSAFYQTMLDTALKERSVENLVFTGCTTSVCVESTLRDAMFRAYRCLLLSDCTAEPIGLTTARSNHEASLLLIEKLFGWVSSSREFLAAMDAFRTTAIAERGS
jgi:ureidoacrylate peracid hydrolase